jgi:hypothetical protein
MGQFSAEKPASPGSGTQATNPRRLQPELNFPTLVSRYFDNEMEQKAGKFMLINPPDAVPVNIVSKMQAGLSRADIETYVSGPSKVQLHGMIEVALRSPARQSSANSDAIRPGIPI